MPAPCPDALAAIARMREITARSADALLLADGPVQPDHRLLDLCGEALHNLTGAEAAIREYHRMQDRQPWTDSDRAEARTKWQGYKAYVMEARRLMRAAMKLQATTPAGIFAKALCVRASRTGAAVLAMSLAQDLVACRELRASLWPAEEVAGREGDGAPCAFVVPTPRRRPKPPGDGPIPVA